MSRKPPIGLEEGWKDLQESIDELIMMCETDFEGSMDVKKVIGNFSKVYNMAVQRPPHNFCEELYTRYKDIFVQYLNHTVLPDLRAKGGQFMLAEVGKRWSNHRAMRPPASTPPRAAGAVGCSTPSAACNLPCLPCALHCTQATLWSSG